MEAEILCGFREAKIAADSATYFLVGHALIQIIKIKKGKMMTHLTLCNKSDGIIL